MKKTNLLLLSICSLLCIMPLHAQLSDRVNSPTTFKTGTRPVSGNLGLAFGTSYQDVKDILDPTRDWEILPFMSFKYYMSKELVLTFGIKSSKDKIKINGDIDPNLDFQARTSFEYTENNSDLMLVPGLEKHFTHSNILDVYVGGRVPLGVRRELSKQKVDFDNGNYNYSTARRNRIFYGIDFLVGVQAFVADLPIALGVEFELSSFGYKGDKTHIIAEDQNNTQDYYTTDIADAFDPTISTIPFSKLHASTFNVETDIRVTLSYFFKR